MTLIIIGLGNPLPKYKNTRHNLGETIVSYFGRINRFPKFTFKKRAKSLITSKEINGEKIILVLPQTFMNQSGRAVKLLIANSKSPIANLFVVHDDIDLPLGEIRIRIKGSAGGHKGIQSIIEHLKNANFIRFKIGIGRPTDKEETEKFVLERFKSQEKTKIQESIKKTCQVIDIALKEGIDRAMSLYN